MEFSDKLLVEFSDKKGCLMTLYSDASVELKILTVILIVERIQASHVYFYPTHLLHNHNILLHVGKRTLTHRSLH